MSHSRSHSSSSLASTSSLKRTSTPDSGDVALEVLSEHPEEDDLERKKLLKGKNRALDSEGDTTDEAPEEFQVENTETAAIEGHLKAWTQAERKRRATIRQSQLSNAPSIADAVNGVSRRSSTLLRRATSKRSHRSNLSNASAPSANGLYPIDSAIELEDTSKSPIKDGISSPLFSNGSKTVYDQIQSPPPLETPTDRALKAGSRFVEDLDSQAPQQPQNLSRRSTNTVTSFFTSIRSPPAPSPIKSPGKPKLQIATDQRSIKSTYSNLGSAGTLDMRPSNSYFDLAPSSSSRDLIGGQMPSDRLPINQGSRKYRRNSEATLKAGEDASSPDDDAAYPLPQRRRKVGWLEWIFCMCCMEEDNQEQGGQTMPESVYRD